MSAWTCITAHLNEIPEDWSRITEAFERHGILGTVQTDDPPTVSAYMPPGTKEAQIDALRSSLLERGVFHVDRQEIEEENWADSWKQFFQPIRIGNRLVIKPTWTDFEVEEKDIVLELDPGQAFGTGDHPTTRKCLELLDGMDLSGKHVCDVGCGSGILSIAAGKLGADRVVGTDIEELAVAIARENAARNAVSATFLCQQGFPDSEMEYDLVLSNIISAAIIDLAPHAPARVVKGGNWIVSGVLVDNWAEVEAVTTKVGFRTETILEENDWIAALLTR